MNFKTAIFPRKARKTRKVIGRDFRAFRGQDVGRNKSARRQQGWIFPAIGAPETPIQRLTRGQAYSGLLGIHERREKSLSEIFVLVVSFVDKKL